MNTIELWLMDVIKDRSYTRSNVVLLYRDAICEGPGSVNWGRVNRAIIERWSKSALAWIKREAWRPERLAGRRKPA